MNRGPSAELDFSNSGADSRSNSSAEHRSLSFLDTSDHDHNSGVMMQHHLPHAPDTHDLAAFPPLSPGHSAATAATAARVNGVKLAGRTWTEVSEGGMLY